MFFTYAGIQLCLTVLPMKSGRMLSFGIAKIDEVFLGFQRGDFAAMFGSSLCRGLMFLLCVRCQLPYRKGGMNSQVVYVDGGNTFNPYAISALAQEYSLDPRSVLEGIFISRAFTAHQLTALVHERLEEALKRYRSKLVIISDITGLFLDRDVPWEEAEDLYKKMTKSLSDLASRRRVIIVASHPPRSYSRRSLSLKSILYGNANMVMGVRESKGAPKFILENHPKILPFTIDLPSNTVTMDTFLEEDSPFLRFLPEKHPDLTTRSVSLRSSMLSKSATLEDFKEV